MSLKMTIGNEWTAPRTLRWPDRRRFHLQVLRAHPSRHPHDGVEFLPEESNSRQEAFTGKVI